MTITAIKTTGHYKLVAAASVITVKKHKPQFSNPFFFDFNTSTNILTAYFNEPLYVPCKDFKDAVKLIFSL